MRLFASLLTAALVAFSPLAHADSILAGSNLSAINGGTGICPNSADCLVVAQQFTVFTPVVIDTVKGVVSAPNRFDFSTDGSFSVGLGSVLGSVPASFPISIGSGDIVFNPQGPEVQEEFDFTGLNLSLGAGTYFLGMTGANMTWDHAPALMNTPGTLGPVWDCDPFLNCSSGRWDNFSGFTYAVEIDGTAITPEPSSFVLIGTGLLGFAGATRRKFFRT